MNFKRIGQLVPSVWEPLLECLHADRSMWDQEKRREQLPGSAHAQAKSITIRGPNLNVAKVDLYNDVDAVDWPMAARLFAVIAAPVQVMLGSIGLVPREADIGRVLLTKLPPMAEITPHIDEGAYADHFDRFHLCLQAVGYSNAFYCGGELRLMAPGEMWWFNHKRMHHVMNAGALDRIHLIVDVVAPDYRRLRDG